MDFSQIDFFIEFDHTSVPKTIVLTDSTIYSAIEPGFDNTMFEAKLKGYLPDGSVFTANALDIDPDGIGSVATFLVSLDAEGEFVEGEYVFEYIATLNGTTTEEHTVTKRFSFEKPSINKDVSIVANCFESVLISTDNTAYGVNATVSRLHTVKYPVNLAVPIADVAGSDVNVILPPNIWTGVYTSNVVSNVVFDESNGFTQRIRYEFGDTYKVICGSLYCLIKCSLSDLLKKIEDGDESALEAASRINLKIHAYNAYASCGDYVKAEEMKKCILEEFETCGCGCEDCENDEDTGDGLPTEVIPIIASSLNVSGGSSDFQYLFGTGLANASIGLDGNLYQNELGDVYKKISGGWILQGNVNGADGATGADGNDGVDATPYFTYILYCDDFTATGVPVNVSASPTAGSRYFSKLETTTEITSFNAASVAMFLPNWVQYGFHFQAASPIDNTTVPATDPVILQDNSHYFTVSGGFYVNLNLTVEFVTQQSFFRLPLSIAFDLSKFNSAILIDQLTGNMIRLRSNASGTIDFFLYDGTQFLANNTYMIEGQFMLFL